MPTWHLFISVSLLPAAYGAVGRDSGTCLGGPHN
jgi:hypothetical protein